MTQSRSGRAGATMVALALLVKSGFGQSLVAPNPRAAEVAVNSRSGGTSAVSIRDLPVATGPRSFPKVDGTAASGLKLTLDGSGSTGGRVWYRWIQTQGVRVAIANADKVEASVIVPEAATTLGFVLVVGNSAGVDARGVTVEVEDLNRSIDVPELHADAGPDQTTIVGRRVILDGKASEPKGHVRYRWVQVSGPKATIQTTTGSTCSLVTNAAGIHQFALLVLGPTNLVSEPAMVTVHAVSSQPGRTGFTADPGMAIDEFTHQAVESIRGGSQHASALAQIMESGADRIESFKTYLEAATELTSRLNAIIPTDPDRRDEWINSFFKPWTTRIAESMRSTGIDVSQSEDQGKPLSKVQRSRLANQFRLTAAGLRSSVQPR